MYTIEEAQKALHDKMLEDMHKQLLLMIHEHAREDITTYNLPYRVLFEYYKANRDDNEISINPYYPYPGIPIEYKPPQFTYRDLGYTGEEWARLIFTPNGEIDENGKQKLSINIPPEIETQIHEWQQAKVRERTGKTYTHIWNLNTEQGRKQWLYYFAVFLLPYADSVPRWNTFDLFGDTNHTEQETNERKRYYMGLIDKCRKNPEIYKHEVAHKDIADYDKYDIKRYFKGYMWNDEIGQEPTPPDTDTQTALTIMYKERERQQARYGEEYPLEARDNYSMCYRIEKIIQQLESRT